MINPSWQDVYIGLGSNLAEPSAQIQKAFQSLAQLTKMRFGRLSPMYTSRPQGPKDQPDFVNAVAFFQTQYPPLALLDQLQSVEATLGKVKTRHWGERLIDLDLLLYGYSESHCDRLDLPHPMMHRRDFVLVPLLDIAPTLCCPKTGLAYQTLLSQLPEHFLITTH